MLLDDIWNDIGFVPVYSGAGFVQFDGTLFVIGSDTQADTLNINAAQESGRRNATDCKSARATSVFYKILDNEHAVPAGEVLMPGICNIGETHKPAGPLPAEDGHKNDKIPQVNCEIAKKIGYIYVSKW